MRPKDQGTRFETEIVRRAQKAGLKAWRLAEGGGNDAGDVVVVTPEGDHYVGECKWRQALNPFDALRKHREKVAKADLPFAVTGVFLVWKRSDPNPEGGRRLPAGTIVVLESGDWLDHIGGISDLPPCPEPCVLLSPEGTPAGGGKP
jgi:hypothetical protein